MTGLRVPISHHSDRLPQRLIETLTAPQRLSIRWRTQYNHRQQMNWLLEHEPRLAKDIGLTIEEVEDEARAPIWKSKYLPPLRLF